MNVVALVDARGGSRKIHAWLIFKIIFSRIGNQENMKVNAPEVYFADAAFKAGMEGDFDLLNELVDFLDQIMQPENDDHEIAKTLYESFYNAIKKGRHIYGKC